MIEIKPSWRIAQQISRRHTLISLAITLPLFIGILLVAIVVLKLLGYENAGLMIRHFMDEHRSLVTTVVAFIHFVPVNLYGIIRIFKVNFSDFKLKIVPKEG